MLKNLLQLVLDTVPGITHELKAGSDDDELDENEAVEVDESLLDEEVFAEGAEGDHAYLEEDHTVKTIFNDKFAAYCLGFEFDRIKVKEIVFVQAKLDVKEHQNNYCNMRSHNTKEKSKCKKSLHNRRLKTDIIEPLFKSCFSIILLLSFLICIYLCQIK